MCERTVKMSVFSLVYSPVWHPPRSSLASLSSTPSRPRPRGCGQPASPWVWSSASLFEQNSSSHVFACLRIFLHLLVYLCMSCISLHNVVNAAAKLQNPPTPSTIVGTVARTGPAPSHSFLHSCHLLPLHMDDLEQYHSFLASLRSLNEDCRESNDSETDISIPLALLLEREEAALAGKDIARHLCALKTRPWTLGS